MRSPHLRAVLTGLAVLPFATSAQSAAIDPASQGGITGTQMGLIADEVSRAFPQWVGRDPKGYQTLTVGGFEALTAEALRELRAEKDCEIEDLRFEIENLKELMRAQAKENGVGR